MSNSRRDFIKKAALGGLTVSSTPLLSVDLDHKHDNSSPSIEQVTIPNRYNIVWITCDEMNTKAMSIYGNAFTRMPGAEQLAMEGTAFNNSYVQMPKSVPSRCSMITGRYPHCEGHRTLTGKKYYETNKYVKNCDFTLTENEPNLVKFLKDNGYKTALIGKNHLVDWNLHTKWFDMTSKWDSPEWKNRPYPFTGTDNPDHKKMQFEGKVKETCDYSMLEDSLHVRWTKEFINNNKNSPFLALIDIGLPHPPYAEYTHMPAYRIPMEEIPAPWVESVDKVPSVERCKRKSYDLEHLTVEDRKLIRRAYYSMCEFADSKVKEIIDEIDNAGLKEKTLIIYSADHGDSNGERNCYEKWDTFFYDEITKVPLIMRLPGVIPAAQCLGNLVEYIDIVPTIMELMGIDVLDWVQGMSLLPLIQGKTKQHKDAVFTQGGVEKDAISRPDREVKSAKQKVMLDFPESMIRSKMVRTERYKYIYRLEGEHELYDMLNDPLEKINLAYNPLFKEIVNNHLQRMLQFTIETETNYPLIDKLIC